MIKYFSKDWVLCIFVMNLFGPLVIIVDQLVTKILATVAECHRRIVGYRNRRGGGCKNTDPEVGRRRRGGAVGDRVRERVRGPARNRQAHRRRRAVARSVKSLVGEAVGAGEFPVRRIGKAAVGVHRHRAVRRAAVHRGAQRVAGVDVPVIRENTRRRLNG